MKIAALSDTHNRHAEYTNLPSADMLIHCGDATCDGTEAELNEFLNWFALQNYQYKIYVPGNHDKALENSSTYLEQVRSFCLKNNITLLIHEAITIKGIKFFGSPYLYHGGYNWFAYGKQLSTLKEHWAKIPSETQILITHIPPKGILDISWDNSLGDKDLLERMKDLKDLKAHFFGHVHHSSGHFVKDGISYINAAMSTLGKTNPVRIFSF